MSDEVAQRVKHNFKLAKVRPIDKKLRSNDDSLAKNNHPVMYTYVFQAMLKKKRLKQSNTNMQLAFGGTTWCHL